MYTLRVLVSERERERERESLCVVCIIRKEREREAAAEEAATRMYGRDKERKNGETEKEKFGGRE